MFISLLIPFPPPVSMHFHQPGDSAFHRYPGAFVEYDAQLNTWYTPLMSGGPPGVRRFHQVFLFNNTLIVVHGGQNRYVSLSDLWCMLFLISNWRNVLRVRRRATLYCTPLYWWIQFDMSFLISLFDFSVDFWEQIRIILDLDVLPDSILPPEQQLV